MSRAYAPLFRSITVSSRLADLPNDTARLFYSWLLTVVDDWGRCTASPRKLNVTVWPMLRKSDKDTEKAIEALRAVGLVQLFPSDDGPFVQIPDHEDKAGSIGKRDHRRASHWPETAILAPLGPDWPALVQAGPPRPSRAIARVCSGLVSSPLLSGSAEGGGLPFASEPFAALWGRWREHRAQLKKPLTKEQERSQLKKLAKEGEAEATARIERSIANGWQGLWFPGDPPTLLGPGSNARASRPLPSVSTSAAYEHWHPPEGERHAV